MGEDKNAPEMMKHFLNWGVGMQLLRNLGKGKGFNVIENY